MMHTRPQALVVLLSALPMCLTALGCNQPAGQADGRIVASEPPTPLETEYRDTIRKLLPDMAREQIPDRKDAQQALEKLCHEAGTPGREKNREALSKAIMAFVGPETAKPARVWLLRKIEPLGRGEAVNGLTALLADADPEIRETARRALANNPSAQALAALRAELAKGGDAGWQIACINALAWRRDDKSVAAFAKLASNKDSAVAAAALAALGDVGDEAALKALKGLEGRVAKTVESTWQDALLRVAERLAPKMAPDDAWATYQPLLMPAQPEHVRVAALTGLAQAGPKAAGGVLLQTVRSEKNPRMQLVAARLLQRMDKSVTPMIVDALKDASPATVAVLLDVLGERGDRSAARTVAGYADNADADVRLAAVEALGKIGGEAEVELLIGRAVAADGAEREAARKSLSTLRGDKVDGVILKALDSADGARRRELIQAVWGRRIAAAKPKLMALAGSGDEADRIAVMNALERLADQNDLPKVVEMLSKATSDAERQAGEQTILSVCRRAGDSEAATGPVVSAMAKSEPRGQVVLLKALGRLQTPGALAAVRKAMQSDDAQVKAAAAAALKEFKPLRVTRWQFAGPFREEGKGPQELFDVAFAPEKEPGGAGFRPLPPRATRDDGVIDLARMPGATSNCCAYLRVTVESVQKQDVILSVGSDDGIKIWLNGQVVHASNVTRGLECDKEQARVTLNEGANVLLVKVTQGGAEWSLCLGVKSPDGGPPEGVRFEAR